MTPFQWFWRGTDLRERLFGRTVALDLAPRLQGVSHTAVGPLATLLRLFQWFSQTHFLIMTLVSIVLIDAFFYHDAFFYGSRGCIFLSWRVFLNGSHRCICLSWRWVLLFSQMHFSIMTPVSMVLTDAFSYHDACFNGNHSMDTLGPNVCQRSFRKQFYGYFGPQCLSK